MRTFDTGATRNLVDGKPEYSRYLSPSFIKRFGEYMASHQIQADGTKRAGDNWQKGIPMDEYMDSGFRHFHDWWELHRMSLAAPLTPELEEQMEEAGMALYFNLQGYFHEHLKRKHGSWSYMLLQEAAKDAADKEVEGYTPDTRPVGEGDAPRSEWPRPAYATGGQVGQPVRVVGPPNAEGDQPLAELWESYLNRPGSAAWYTWEEWVEMHRY
jgi:hypothetical protein